MTDFRRHTMKQLTQLLLSNGLSQQEIDHLKRWDRVHRLNDLEKQGRLIMTTATPFDNADSQQVAEKSGTAGTGLLTPTKTTRYENGFSRGATGASKAKASGSIRLVLLILIVTIFIRNEEKNSRWWSASSPPRKPDPVTITSDSPPRQCTSYQLEIITKMLPTSKRIHFATKCPDTSSWLLQEADWYPSMSVFVGCNKGFDAIQMLQWASQNDTFTKNAWKQAMPGGDRMSGGACGQDKDSTSVVLGGSSTSHSSLPQVYCIEAMPSTANSLQTANHQLAWDQQLHVFHYAMAEKTSGTIAFPNGTMGIENLGLSDCVEQSNRMRNQKASCVDVPVVSLDDFATKEQLLAPPPTVQQEKAEEKNDPGWYLLVDVEGFDWPVLLGASQTLSQKVAYLEFEYHDHGAWSDYSLQKAVSTLFEEHQLVCYWAGSKGRLWRMTQCWRDSYDEWKQWSNVACASLTKAPELVERMENRFLEDVWKFETRLYLEEQKGNSKKGDKKTQNQKEPKERSGSFWENLTTLECLFALGCVGLLWKLVSFGDRLFIKLCCSQGGKSNKAR